jgi:hypothetical protein
MGSVDNTLFTLNHDNNIRVSCESYLNFNKKIIFASCFMQFVLRL